jgi:hypothetical protein
MTRLPFLSLIALPLIACGYTVEYSGQVEDEHGLARQGVAVALSDVGYADGRYTDFDVVARAENKETGVTDAAGRFSLAHDYSNGGFGCGIDFAPVVIIAPDGPRGAVAVAQVTDDEAQRTVDVGPIRMVGALEAHADGEGVYLALGHHEGDAVVQIDGQRWYVGQDDVLPAAALAACPTSAPCDHPMARVGEYNKAHVRGPISMLSAIGAKPAAQLRSTDDDLYNGTRLSAPVSAATIYVDLIDGAAPLEKDELPTVQLSIATDAGATRYASVATSSCAVYGSGVRCEGPAAAITGVRVQANGPTQVRVFAR